MSNQTEIFLELRKKAETMAFAEIEKQLLEKKDYEGLAKLQKLKIERS